MNQPLRATAPYTSIDFPDFTANGEQLMPASALWPENIDTAQILAAHDRWLPGTHAGWIDLTLTALTPLFIGGNTIDPQLPLRLGSNGPYAIPHTTLTGMLRNLTRILTGGRLGPISTPVMFFRAPIRPGNGDHSVRAKVTRKLNTKYVEQVGVINGAGFLQFNGTEALITPLTTGLPLTVDLKLLQSQLVDAGIAMDLPPDPDAAGHYLPTAAHPDLHGEKFRVLHDGQRVWSVHVDKPGENPDVVRANMHRSAREAGCAHATGLTQCKAMLWFTGMVGVARAKAYFFPIPTKGLQTIGSGALKVPPQLLRLFESSEQLTQWQKKNFPGPEGQHDKDGLLWRDRPNPVWYTSEIKDGETRVRAFGRSGGFRVAMHDDAQDMVLRAVPPPLHPRRAAKDAPAPNVDVAEALFGAAGLPGSPTAFRRRVGVGTATTLNSVGLEDAVDVLLLSPQRTCFAHYVVQSDPQDVITWADQEATLRGYKIYLHRWNNNQGVAEQIGTANDNPQVITTIRPLPAETEMRARIRFTNLTPAELGCLMSVLYLGNSPQANEPTNPTHAHKIGMGKALGLGTVHLQPRLFLVDTTARYAPPDPGSLPTLMSGVREASRDDIESLVADFGAALIEGYPTHENPDDWTELRHVKQLLAASRWSDRLPAHATMTMPVTSFGEYRVLPGVLDRFGMPG